MGAIPGKITKMIKKLLNKLLNKLIDKLLNIRKVESKNLIMEYINGYRPIDHRWVNIQITPLQRKAMWNIIKEEDAQWTCKKCGSYGQDCDECKDYHDYIIKAAPFFIDAMEYLRSLYRYHRDKVYSWEDYETP